MIGIKIDGIDIHCVNGILFFLVNFLLYNVDHAAFCNPLRNGSSCCTSHISFHIPGIICVGGLNHSICIFIFFFLVGILQLHAGLTLFASDHVLLFVLCQTPSCHSGCQ